MARGKLGIWSLPPYSGLAARQMKITTVEQLPGKGIAVITDERTSDHSCRIWRVGEYVVVKLPNGNSTTAQILGLEIPHGPLEPPLIILLGGIDPADVEPGAEIHK
jgi:hypothetical protein